MCDFSSFGGRSEEWVAVEASLPSPPAGESFSETTRRINKEREEIAAAGVKALASPVLTRDFSIPTRDGSVIEARSYRSVDLTESTEPQPVYIHLHGGGFVFGTLDSEDGICSRLAVAARVIILNVNYRHTPEHTYPTAWHDAEDAFKWTHDNINDLGGDSGAVVMGGISAGAQLTASLVLGQHLGKTSIATYPPIAGQVLMIPCLVNPECYEPQLRKMKDPSVSSYKENIDAPILPVTRVKFFTDLLRIESLEVDDLALNPGNALPSQVKGLPPTTFGITGLDPLRDEGLLYAKMLAEEG
jgi:acetyl esterase/lipase